MKNDERKLMILQAIILSYISNPEPVGSRTIQKKYDLGVSPATIRNEMSDLEELGLLIQPHTSAGRIPSDKAFRLYVDRLMDLQQIAFAQQRSIHNSLLNDLSEVEKIVENSAKLLSQLTEYTTFAISPKIEQDTLKRIRLIPVDDTKTLVVLITAGGIAKDFIIRNESNIEENQLNLISEFLTEKLENTPIYQLGYIIDNVLMDELESMRFSARSLLPMINNTLSEINDTKIFANGVLNIFNFPDYHDFDRAQSLVKFMQTKGNVKDMLLNSGGAGDVRITIGRENLYDVLKACTMITATYTLKGQTVGKLALVGPTNMDYGKIIPLMRSVAREVNEILAEYYET
jgi:heat-inducible transcriptional repressor